MKPDKPISDEQLDRLLRAVEIPDDLKAKLHNIPFDHVEESVTVHSQSKRSAWSRQLVWIAALAASLLVAAFAVMQPWKPIQQTNHAHHNSQGEIKQPDKSESADAEQLLAEIKQAQHMIDLALHQLKIDALQSTLDSFDQPVHYRLDPIEIESMIVALAGQTYTSFGGTEAQVQKEMAKVIKLYPETRGAKIAESYLAQQ